MTRPNVNVAVGGPKNDHQTTYKTIVLKENIPFGSQVGTTNTKYVIKWDFDLGGSTVTIPQDCIISFDGGRLNNGTINGQNTLLTGIVNCNTTISGTFANDYLDITWFGARGDDNFDNSTITNNVFDTCINSKSDMFIPEGTYAIKSGRFIARWGIPFNDADDSDPLDDLNYESLNNIKVFGCGRNSIIKSYSPGDVANFYYVKDLCIEGIQFTSVVSYVAQEHGQNLISFVNAKNIHIEKIYAHNSFYVFPGTDNRWVDGGSGITFQGYVFENCIVEDCDIDNCSYGVNIYFSDRYSAIDSNTFVAVNNVRVKKCIIGVLINTPASSSDNDYNIYESKIIINARTTNCVSGFVGHSTSGVTANIQNIQTEDIETLYKDSNGNSIFRNTTIEHVAGYFKDVCVATIVYPIGNNITITSYSRYLNYGYIISGSWVIGNRTIQAKNNILNLSLNTDCEIVKKKEAAEITDEDTLLIKTQSNALDYYFVNTLFLLTGLNLPVNKIRNVYKGYEESVSVIVDGHQYTNKNTLLGNNSIGEMFTVRGAVAVKNSYASNQMQPGFIVTDFNKNIVFGVNGYGELSLPSITYPSTGGTGSIDSGYAIPIRELCSPNAVLGFIKIYPYKTKGTTDERPENPNQGNSYFDVEVNKPIFYNGVKWLDYRNVVPETPTSGIFSDKPSSSDVYIGYGYFCTDRKIDPSDMSIISVSSDTGGMMIYSKGSNIWVDALGRVVS